MALPANTYRYAIVLTLAAAGAAANAQSLNQPNPLERLSDVVQFGVPRDTKFVFCDSEDCPERSIKHLYIAPLPPPPAVQDVMPAPQSIQPPDLSRAKVEPKPVKKTAKKKRKKPAVKYECKPVTPAK